MFAKDSGADNGLQSRLTYLAATTITAGLLFMGLGRWLESTELIQTAGMMVISGLACAVCLDRLRAFRFTLWIVMANLAAMLVPHLFLSVRGYSLTDAWLLLIIVQLIMFGMGTQMRLGDFAQVARMPAAVAIGLACQFLIMPLLGYSIAKLFRFPPEIGAGLVLIGSCSSGLASNVLTFLAKGNLALSVTMTAFATALAPVLTPIWMKTLAGSMVQINGLQMSLDIIKMVIVPLMAAFVAELLVSSQFSVRRRVLFCVGLSGVWLLFLVAGGWQIMLDRFEVAHQDTLRSLLAIPGFVAAAFVVGACYRGVLRILPTLPHHMPKLSMWGIVYFTLVTTAKGRDQLLAVGFMLLLATALHNVFGYMIGYWGARGLGLSQQDSRTIAIEVGTQNGAMATGLARSMNRLETVGLAAMIFAPLMNVTGSILANFWRRNA